VTNGEFDPLSLLSTLNRHGVGYMVVGGFAAVAYGSPLPTGDIDVTPDTALENLDRLSAALRELEARIRTEAVPEGLAFAHNARSLSGLTMLNLVTRFGELDLILRIPGEATYQVLSSRAVTLDLEGMPLRLASLDDIIASKEAAGRPKDRNALPILRALRDRLRQGKD
jgi:hypothetical protein